MGYVDFILFFNHGILRFLFVCLFVCFVLFFLFLSLSAAFFPSNFDLDDYKEKSFYCMSPSLDPSQTSPPAPVKCKLNRCMWQ